MSEVMAIEKLAENLLELDGFFTEARIPYLAKFAQNGEKKKDLTLGDIDVIGFSQIEDKFIAVETKAYGSIESYENWCKSSRIIEIYGIAENLTNNVNSIKISKWNNLFKKRKKFDEIWIVISGYFVPKQSYKYYGGDYEGNEFTNKVRKKIDNLYQDKIIDESIYLRLLEEELEKELKIKFNIIPIHLLIEKLILKTDEDMAKRRVRYPDTSLETFRWMIRAIKSGAFNLGDIQQKIKK